MFQEKMSLKWQCLQAGEDWSLSLKHDQESYCGSWRCLLYWCGFCWETEPMGQREGKSESERLIHFQGLAHIIVGTGKSDICRAGQQAGNSGNSWHGGLESEICRLDTWTGFLCYSLETEFLSQDLLGFILKAFNRMTESHAHCEG